MKMGPCEYCSSQSPVFVEESENSVESFLCGKCLNLLRNPLTALPLIRGNLTMKLRGTMSEKKLNDTLNSFMEKLSKFHPQS